MPARPSPSQAPPWEALSLVASFLDAGSLAAASCVSTSWHAAFAADHLWARLCRSHYPSAIALLPLHSGSDGNAAGRRACPHRGLYALFHAASSRGRSLPAPRLALADVAFCIDLFAASGEATLSFAVAASDAGVWKAPGGVFQFGVDVSGRNAAAGPGEHWSVRWTAVRTGLAPAAAIVMMDAKVPASRAGALGSGERGEAWATERMPAPGCGGGKLEAEVVVGVTGEERLVETVRLGVLLDCRYVSVDEGLRYLQHFLL
ncbi:probable F-box protein At5g04010 [Lolium rigidum]|uniref:probable F-box protein At5g04010 n=1 Tax=Lolium rigidum TaxID=89674 RepID=UPI001F5DCE1F|nr:probable F-box protein At5g04010 [Lolium rigidum]